MTDAAAGGERHALVPLFIEVAPTDIALLKFLFESYEGVAVVRTLDRSEALIVALVSADFLDVALAMLRSLEGSIDFRRIPPPAAAGDDWLMRYVEGWDEGDGSSSSGSIFQRSQR